MSLAGCYTLALLCDSPTCPDRVRTGRAREAEYCDELGSTCRSQARQAGWRWTSGNDVRCPFCAKRE